MAGKHGADRAAARPEEFDLAVRAMRAARLRPEVVVVEVPAPQRLAPFAAAITADVAVDGDDLATGRLVLLHDPAGPPAWHGTFRLVSYVRAQLDPEMGADPLLGAVGWSWLTEALAEHGAQFVAPSGTVTRVASESFGAIAGEVAEAEIEIRASWTPTTPAIGAHVEAWADLMCTVAGIPPLPAGVVSLPAPRGR